MQTSYPSIDITSQNNIDTRKLLLATCTGSLLEFYDFSAVIIFASSLTVNFLPAGQHANVLWIFAIFSLGYLVRPIGSILISHLGDRYGRKKTFQASMVLISLSTLTIGILPNYATLGIFSLIMLVLCRVIQGLSVSGEIAGAAIFSCEHLSGKKRGVICAMILASGSLGTLLAASTGLVITQLLTSDQIHSWGWRIPFIFGSSAGLVGYLIRRSITETPVFIAMVEQGKRRKLPFRDLLKEHKMKVYQAIGLSSIPANFYAIYQLIPTFSSRHLGASVSMGYQDTVLIIGLFALLSVFSGALSSSYSRMQLLLTATLALLLISPAMIWLLTQGHILSILILLTIPAAIVNGCYLATIMALFEPSIRYTGLAFSFNVAITLFSSTTPLVVEWLAQHGVLLGPVYVMIFSALLTILVSLKRGLPSS